MREGAHVVLGALDADDDVERLRIEGEVDVRLRGQRIRARVGVVDRPELEPGLLDRVLDLVLLHPVDLVAQRAGGGVARAVHGDRLAVAAGDHPAALVGRVRARVGDDVVEQLAGDPHEPDVSGREVPLVLLGGGALERGVLVVVIVAARVAADGVLELAHPVADRATDLRKALGAEHDQGDDEHDDELTGADVEWHGLGILSGVRGLTEVIGAERRCTKVCAPSWPCGSRRG